MLNKGRITTEFTVWCRCECWSQISCKARSYAIKAFKASGWKRTNKHGWLCPGCLEWMARPAVAVGRAWVDHSRCGNDGATQRPSAFLLEM